MITIKDTKIWNISKNKFQDLKISFVIKKEDYDPDMENKLYKLCEDWSLWVLVFQWTEFTEDTWKNYNQIKNELLQKLDFFIKQYWEKEIVNIEDLKIDLYKRYWVESRSELNIEQLKKEVESFKFWLIYN